MNIVIYGLVYLGSALMVYNIWGFISYVRYVKKLESTSGRKVKSNAVLYVPVALLVMFLLGYLLVGILGDPDIIVSGILFGGSVFVFIMYILLFRITARIVEAEKVHTELVAAEQSNRDKTEFLSSVSHEMRTPMNIIIGLDAIALTDPTLSAQTKDYLEKIGLSAKHLLGLINSILDLNSIEAGEAAVKPERFSLGEAVDQLGVIAGTLCGEKGLDFTSSVAEGAKGIYNGDAMMIKKVLLNILDNAVKYTDAPGKVALGVDCVPGEGDGRSVIFKVSDTGAGIGAQFIPKLFDVFSREDASSTSAHGGAGLGLAVAKKTVDLLGGTIEVESEKGVGSTFTVTLPLRFEAEPEPVAEDEPKLESLAGCRILIVEDLPENAEIVADLLELEEATSKHAENGRIGVNMFEASEPGYYDAILMDLRMPVMDGLTATREIRKLDRPDAATIPIIALTANAFDTDIKQSLDAGMDAHLAKPADSDLLYETLKTYIARARSAKGETTK